MNGDEGRSPTDLAPKKLDPAESKSSFFMCLFTGGHSPHWAAAAGGHRGQIKRQVMVPMPSVVVFLGTENALLSDSCSHERRTSG